MSPPDLRRIMKWQLSISADEKLINRFIKEYSYWKEAHRINEALTEAHFYKLLDQLDKLK